MIGNDIVDLKEAAAKSNWQRQGFLDKLFTTEEQQYISNSNNPFIMVWRLWSMKEAAYKLYTQLYPSRFYNPKQFQCTIEGVKTVVKYRFFQCYVNTKITSAYILSEARLDKKPIRSKTVVSTNSNLETLRKIVKTALLQSVSKHYAILRPDLKLLKSEFGIPSVYKNNEQLPIGISISHHGNYGAFCHTERSQSESRNLNKKIPTFVGNEYE